MRRITAVPTLLLMLILSACGSPPPQGGAGDPAAQPKAASPAGSGPDAGVGWFAGGVEQAFAQARAEGKPVLLFWSAVWCPHCHHLENKIFRHPAFLEPSRGFIAVHLDSDALSAQIWGEKLDTQGYPTVILFDSQGQELWRMSSDTAIEQYVQALESVRARPRPVEQVLAAVRGAAPGQADPSDLDLLATYAWDQDSRLKLLAAEKPSIFKLLYDATPAERAVARSRFLFLWLGALVPSGEPGAPPPPALAESERAAARSAVVALLSDPALRRANLGSVLGASGAVTGLLAPGAERPELASAWEQAARELENDPELSTDDRLSALFPRLELAVLAGGPLPAPLVEHVRERVAWAAENVNEPSELQTTLGTLTSALEQAGLGSEIEPLIERKMSQTQAPYYYMSALAARRAQAGDKEGALDWHRKAHEGSQGRYTRFRWGSTYLRQLMRLEPDDVSTIEASTREILGELLKLDDAFAGSNFERLAQLGQAYQAWATQPRRAAVVSGLRALVQAECARFPAEGEDSQQKRCSAFLAGG